MELRLVCYQQLCLNNYYLLFLTVELENKPSLTENPGLLTMEDYVAIIANGKVYKLTKTDGQFAIEETMTSLLYRNDAVYFSIPVDHHLVENC